MWKINIYTNILQSDLKKMIQIIKTFDKVLSHILNMSWLYHFNSIWKIPLCDFTKIFGWIFHSKKENYVEKTKLKNDFYLKDNRNYVEGFLYQNSFNMFIKMLDEIKEKTTPT